ncbi:hypothetical protein Purlil1_13856 [Purpureocillium lilacinum]|uniref:Uncharacterized protein n=1 Tax=Purpureocillium lilacinum TaxID=33203 RepID=A0ABR0BD24_PURLI|nr:hypothetical protein Purlil1_13856 [Purpureocillium lilacinum]
MSAAANDERALGQRPKTLQRSHGRSLVAITDHSQKGAGLGRMAANSGHALQSWCYLDLTECGQNWTQQGGGWRHPEWNGGILSVAERGQNWTKQWACLVASRSKTRLQLDEAVGLAASRMDWGQTGGIPHNSAARTGRSSWGGRVNWSTIGTTGPLARIDDGIATGLAIGLVATAWKILQVGGILSRIDTTGPLGHFPPQDGRQLLDKIPNGRTARVEDGRDCDGLYSNGHEAASVVSSSRGQLFWLPPRGPSLIEVCCYLVTVALGGIPQETRPELDEAVGLTGGILLQNAARIGRSSGDWRHPTAAARGQNWRHPVENAARTGRSSGADWRNPA